MLLRISLLAPMTGRSPNEPSYYKKHSRTRNCKRECGEFREGCQVQVDSGVEGRKYNGVEDILTHRVEISSAQHRTPFRHQRSRLESVLRSPFMYHRSRSSVRFLCAMLVLPMHGYCI